MINVDRQTELSEVVNAQLDFHWLKKHWHPLTYGFCLQWLDWINIHYLVKLFSSWEVFIGPPPNSSYDAHWTLGHWHRNAINFYSSWEQPATAIFTLYCERWGERASQFWHVREVKHDTREKQERQTRQVYLRLKKTCLYMLIWV